MPEWVFVIPAIGVILAAIAIVLNRWHFLLQRKRKELACGVESDTPLLNHEEEVRGVLKIAFERKAVEDVHLVVYRVENSGNVSILQTDYNMPVSVNFGPESRILTVSTITARPETLKPVLTHDASSFSFAPLLLNGGDTFDIRAIVTKPERYPKVDGRLVEVPRIFVSVRSRHVFRRWVHW